MRPQPAFQNALAASDILFDVSLSVVLLSMPAALDVAGENASCRITIPPACLAVAGSILIR